jgi:hypothetical protein
MPPRALAGAGANFGEDLLRVGVLTGGLPGVDEVAIHQDLEYSAARRHYRELRYLEFELF